jgi:uncharacterized damage-inducible protein DinB
VKDIRETNADLLHEAATLVARLRAEHFTMVQGPAMTASIGAHVRHVLDYYHALLRDLPTRRIDYEKRARNGQLESDRDSAATELRRFAVLLVERADLRVDVLLAVRDGAIMNGGWSRSTLERELGFLLSHATHHCSLMAVACRLQGIEVAPDFGLAPSTLRHLVAARNARAS